jgi:hypothetical protein
MTKVDLDLYPPNFRPNPSSSSLPPPPSPEDEFEFEIPDAKNYEKQMVKKLDSNTLMAMKKLAYYVATVGLSFEESCELVRYEPEEVNTLIQSHPYIGRYLRLKEIEFKKDLLKILSLQAKDNKNEKWAEWMLRSRFPEEFGTPKQRNSGSSEDEVTKSLTAMLHTIRKDGQGNTLVEEKKMLRMINNGNGLATDELADETKAKAKEVKALVFEALK